MNRKRSNPRSRTGTARRSKSGRPQPSEQGKTISGTISVHPRGFGFVTSEHSEKDLFIPPHSLNNALSDDQVLVSIQSEDARGPVGKVEKILRRGHSEVVGVFAFDAAGEAFIQPLRQEIPENVPLSFASEKSQPPPSDLEEGDWIEASLQHPDGQGQALQAEFTRRIAKPGAISADLDAIVAAFDLTPAYSAEENRAAAACQPVDIERHKLDDKIVLLTIDPEDAKDFDDAISLQVNPESGTATVGVHVADVAAYATPDSELEKGAALRGFTAYLPGRTLHMLPPALAAERCSLRQGAENLAHSVFLEIDRETGEVLDRRRCHSRVAVTRRLSFDQAQAIIDRPEAKTELPEPVKNTVLELHRLAETMRRRRQETEHFLELESREVRVLCDEEHEQITGLKPATAAAADHLVEEFMLAANVAVACEMRDRKIPGIYRIHSEPDPLALREFVEWAGEIGLRFKGKLENRFHINRFLAQAKPRHDREIINSMFLRTLSRATYSAKPAPHYGLGKESYCHFTSPIRRYTDLVVHQQLWAADQGEAARDQKACTAIASRCTIQEKNNDEAYFAALDRMKIRYLQELRIRGERLFYEGAVLKVGGDGLLVFIPELGIVGKIPKDQIPRKSAGRVWRGGNVIYVTVDKADPIRGRLLLAPAGT